MMAPWKPAGNGMGEAVSESNLVEVFHADNEVEALLYQTMLEEAGINVMARRSGDAISTSVIYPVPHLGIDLLVSADESPEATRLVEEFQQRAEAGELAVPEGMSSVVDVRNAPGERRSTLTIHDLIIRGGLVLAALIVLAIIIIYAFFLPH